MIVFRDLGDTAEDAAALTRFYDLLYIAEFPDPDERESLANMLDYLRKRTVGWYERNNYHILLAIEDEQPVGGSIADFLAEPNVGVIEFLVVAGGARGSGVGRALLARTESLLVRDAERLGGEPLAAIVAEMNDPLAPAVVPDNLDPARRALIWHRWGYKGLDFPYVQPALSAEQTPVTTLVMIGKALRSDWQAGFPAPVVLLAVHEYLRWAMRIDAPEEDPDYRRMAEYLDSVDEVPTLSLARYVGRDADRPVLVREITDPADPDFAPTMRQYREAFGDGPLAIGEAEFRTAISGGAGYHLWSVRGEDGGPVGGVASFFGLDTAGFGGYLALTGALRGTGRLRPLIALIEQRLLREHPAARGWYIEVGPDTDAGPFDAVGFREIAIDYRQPDLARPETGPAGTGVRLMYKPFGRCYGVPDLTAGTVLAAIEDVLRVVYGIDEPRTHRTYGRAVETLPADEATPSFPAGLLTRPVDRNDATGRSALSAEVSTGSVRPVGRA
ncbi:MAG TPA: GNAT family N-acetyltransferase [Pseudonocardiaceae bacterium]|jgi:GNAT superfamily N-acetyltransferase|nr:GNAT family N-acetyltransferase [Pseudonocardiaceae bacterium]